MLVMTKNGASMFGGIDGKMIRKFFRPAMPAVIVILFGIIIYLAWQNWQYQRQRDEVSNAAVQEHLKEENQKMLDQLAKHFLLPSGEEPTIAYVQDVDTLKIQQPFFADAQNGDRLLIYSQAHKAIIYRWPDDVIINVGPVNFSLRDEEGDGNSANTIKE